MAFNLFKRKEIADIIFKGGTIYTMDIDAPIAENLACKDGIIIALGGNELLEEYTGTHTQIVDLKSKFILPGFIEANGNPADTALDGSYAKLDETMTPQDIISAIAAFQKMHPLSDSYIAYGYDESIVNEDNQTQIRDSFNELSTEKPILAIAADGVQVLLNSASEEIIKERAEELGIPVITPDFAMSILVSTDYETLIKNAINEAYTAAGKGYTSIFNIGTFRYFDNTYRDFLIDLYQMNMTKQRYFSSLLLNRPFSERRVLGLLDQNHTACTELEGKINFDTLYIQCTSDEDKHNYMSEEYLNATCDRVADKGYNIRIDAFDRNIAIQALNILGNLQSSYRKPTFSVEYDKPFTEEELSEIFTGDVHIHTKSAKEEQAQCVQNEIDERTTKASTYLGIADRCGSIEKGKWADFAVYSIDPTQAVSVKDLEKRQADMTVLGGEIVYRKEDDTLENWVKKLTEHFSSINEDFSL